MGELLEAAMRFRDALHQGWCQGYYAQNERGLCSLSPKTPLLTSSVYTELPKVATEESRGVELQLLIEGLVPDGDISGWNDDPSRTYAEVLALADAVCRRAKELEESA